MLTLDPKHPGLHDSRYVRRRTELFHLAQKHRLQNKGIPLVEYTEEEHAVWQQINQKLEPLHKLHACTLYQDGKKHLELNPNTMPNLALLNEKLIRTHDVQLVVAEGLIPPRAFFDYLSRRIMPCTQYIRHGSQPAYTPEPDAVHDIIGHVPPLFSSDYAEIVALFGEGVRRAKDHELLAWERIYWFTIEFGLIEEQGHLKSFGAGLLSSAAEMTHAHSQDVILRPLSLTEIVHTDYDPTTLQPILFVIPTLNTLKQQLLNFL